MIADFEVYWKGRSQLFQRYHSIHKFKIDNFRKFYRISNFSFTIEDPSSSKMNIPTSQDPSYRFSSPSMRLKLHFDRVGSTPVSIWYFDIEFRAYSFDCIFVTIVAKMIERWSSTHSRWKLIWGNCLFSVITNTLF